jgi:hypothetical protein
MEKAALGVGGADVSKDPEGKEEQEERDEQGRKNELSCRGMLVRRLQDQCYQKCLLTKPCMILTAVIMGAFEDPESGILTWNSA